MPCSDVEFRGSSSAMPVPSTYRNYSNYNSYKYKHSDTIKSARSSSYTDSPSSLVPRYTSSRSSTSSSYDFSKTLSRKVSNPFDLHQYMSTNLPDYSFSDRFSTRGTRLTSPIVKSSTTYSLLSTSRPNRASFSLLSKDKQSDTSSDNLEVNTTALAELEQQPEIVSCKILSKVENNADDDDDDDSQASANISPRRALKKEYSEPDTAGLCGLRNIGNTCFMNSVLQCLSNTRALKDFLIGKELALEIKSSETKGALIKAFVEVVSKLWAAEGQTVDTTALKSQIQRYAPRFMGYNQQDAQEFLRYLLEGLHNDINRVSVKPRNLPEIDDSLSDSAKASESWKQYLRCDNSSIVDLFVGQLKSTLQCTTCKHKSTTFEVFWDLSLPLPSRASNLKLSACLDHFTKEEVLDGDEMPTCSQCKARRKCTKRFSIQRFPKILVFHIKRFSPSERYRKLSATVEFPLTNLDMSAYSNGQQATQYNLYAVSNHSGSAYSGHYTAYCLHSGTQQWYEFNDSRVSTISPRTVVSSEAYILFYEQITSSRLSN